MTYTPASRPSPAHIKLCIIKGINDDLRRSINRKRGYEEVIPVRITSIIDAAFATAQAEHNQMMEELKDD